MHELINFWGGFMEMDMSYALSDECLVGLRVIIRFTFSAIHQAVLHFPAMFSVQFQ